MFKLFGLHDTPAFVARDGLDPLPHFLAVVGGLSLVSPDVPAVPLLCWQCCMFM